MNLFVFPHAVKRRDAAERVRLDIDGGVLRFFLNDECVMIDTEVLRDGSSTMVLDHPLTGKIYALYNFRELLEVLDLTPSELLNSFQQRGFMQVDKCAGDVFVKVFVFDNELASETTDFSGYAHYTKDFIHPLDWRYSWTLEGIEGCVVDGTLKLELELVRSDFWQRDVYISHGGQFAKLEQGRNRVEFRYNPTENAYVGNPNCRYRGRAIELDRLLKEGM